MLRHTLTLILCALPCTSVFMSSPSNGFNPVLLDRDLSPEQQQLGTAVSSRTMEGHIRCPYKLAFSPNGRMLAAISCWEKIPRVWDVTTGKETLQLHGQQEGGYDSIAFSPDSKLIITGGHDRTARLWDTSTGNLMATLPGHTHAIISADGRKIATYGGSSSLDMWKVWKVGASSEDKTPKLWDARTGKLIAMLMGHKDQIFAATFSPDSKTLITGAFDGLLIVWNTDDGRQRTILNGPPDNRKLFDILDLDISPDGRMLAVAGSSSVPLFDLQSGSFVFLNTGQQSVRLAIFSPDGRTLATSSRHDPHVVKLWDVETLTLKTTLKGDKDNQWEVAFSPVPEDKNRSKQTKLTGRRDFNLRRIIHVEQHAPAAPVQRVVVRRVKQKQNYSAAIK
jgi:WD40 repeat protein